MLLTAPLLKLPRARERRLVGLVMAWFVGQICAWPFLAPVYHRAELSSLQTHLDREGICRQNTDYTCGSAAAVTLLRQMGWPAEEGDLAVRAGTSRALGTPPSTLCQTLAGRYGGDGLRCEYRAFRSVAELGEAGPTLAVICFGFLTDHYVAVLRVGEGMVEVGDPLLGRCVLPQAEFEHRWRFVGIVLRRAPGGSAAGAETARR